MIQFSSSLDGSAFSGLQLLDGLLAAGWTTHALFAHDGPMIERYRQRGHQTQICAHKNWLRQPRVWQFWRNWREAKRDARAMLPALQRIGPDVAYVNSGASYAGACAAHRARIPTVWHIRELFAEEGGELHAPLGFRHAIRSCFQRMARAHVANSRHVADAVLGPSQALHVVCNAVDDAYFEKPFSQATARAELGLDVHATIVGIPGTLRAVKGQDFALRAMAPWLLANNQRVLALSGSTDSPYASMLRAAADRLGISPQVAFVGRQADMRIFYDACDAALVPSRSESFGRVAAEAMARGVPLVASRAGGLPEVVRHQVSGLTFEYGDEESLVREVETLISDHGLRQRLRARALEEVRSRFTLDRYQRDIVGLVTQLGEAT